MAPARLPDISAVTTATGYFVNSSITAVFYSSPGLSATFTQAPGGVFALPGTGFSDACSGLSVVGYMARQPEAGHPDTRRLCGRSVSSPIAACADSGFSGFALINLLGLAKSPDSPLYQRVQVWVASYLDPLTGLITVLTAYNTSSTGGFPVAVPAPVLRANGACDFVLKAVDFLILNDRGNGDVAYVLANVTFTVRATAPPRHRPTAPPRHGATALCQLVVALQLRERTCF